MKRMFFLALILTLVTTAVTAQRICPNRAQLTQTEVRHLRNDQRHFRDSKRIARRDGVVTPREHRRLKMIRKHERRDLYRFKHNKRRRLAAANS
jgi:hypothetical protein